ncbi:hypothetical protein RUM44_000642 [Polyplax serrata]|uniref:Uncharacterized protein n=1 Tax=Polyplax serrata TaxID=468196 RepID=A0ABR1B875_POLSC
MIAVRTHPMGKMNTANYRYEICRMNLPRIGHQGRLTNGIKTAPEIAYSHRNKTPSALQACHNSNVQSRRKLFGQSARCTLSEIPKSFDYECGTRRSEIMFSPAKV